MPEGGSTARLERVKDMAEKLLAEHGLGGWTVQWSRARQQAGRCDRKGRVILLSAPLMSVWTPAQARDTILHEIAHALTTGAHNAEWKRKCAEIGAIPSASWGGRGERVLPGKWRGTCPAGHVVFREYRPKGRISCSRCSRIFDPRFLIRWEVNR